MAEGFWTEAPSLTSGSPEKYLACVPLVRPGMQVVQSMRGPEEMRLWERQQSGPGECLSLF